MVRLATPRDVDLFVLVAEPAGCPNAFLETMARGLPVVATDAGGMRERFSMDAMADAYRLSCRTRNVVAPITPAPAAAA